MSADREAAQPDRPGAGEYAEFYAGYVARVPDGDVLALLEAQGERTLSLLAGVSPERAAFRYAEGKWSVKQVVLHLCDAERVMSYRLLRIGRGDATPLAGFDEAAYAPASGAEARTMASLAAELAAVRAATVTLARGLPAEAWTRRGEANGQAVSARALPYIVLGHELHHLAILDERYGVGAA